MFIIHEQVINYWVLLELWRNCPAVLVIQVLAACTMVGCAWVALSRRACRRLFGEGPAARRRGLWRLAKLCWACVAVAAFAGWVPLVIWGAFVTYPAYSCTSTPAAQPLTQGDFAQSLAGGYGALLIVCLGVAVTGVLDTVAYSLAKEDSSS